MTHILQVLNQFSPNEMEQLKTSYSYLQARGLDVNISLLYINPYVPSAYFSIPSIAELSERFDNEAKSALTKSGQYFDVCNENHWIANGNIKKQALRLASNLKADAIIVSQEILNRIKETSLNHQDKHFTTVDKLAVT